MANRADTLSRQCIGMREIIKAISLYKRVTCHFGHPSINLITSESNIKCKCKIFAKRFPSHNKHQTHTNSLQANLALYYYAYAHP